jgi:hypothetical protein
VTDTILKDLSEFKLRVPVLLRVYEKEIGESPRKGLSKVGVDSLMTCVARNPSQHIASYDGDVIYNRFVPNVDYYFLGEGDSDPSLVVIPSLREDDVLQWILRHLSISSLIAKGC